MTFFEGNVIIVLEVMTVTVNVVEKEQEYGIPYGDDAINADKD